MVNGNVVTTTTPGGQKLYITSVLPADATITTIPIAGALTTVADLEPCQYRMVIQDPNNPADERFLHVFQGANAGVPADGVTRVQSSTGTSMDGAAVGNALVLFTVNDTSPFTGTAYTAPATASQHYLTGCVTNGFYKVTSTTSANGVTVTVIPASSGLQADSAGVLAFNAVTLSLPLLNIASSPPNVILSWSTNAAGFVLNQTPGLSLPIIWTPVTNGITVSGTNYTTSVKASSGSVFYQLIAP